MSDQLQHGELKSFDNIDNIGNEQLQILMQVSIETFEDNFNSQHASYDSEESNEIDYEKILNVEACENSPNEITSNKFPNVIKIQKTQNEISCEKSPNEISSQKSPNEISSERDTNEKTLGKKRGRKQKKNSKKKTHTKSDPDNILTKIQVNYITFLKDFINKISNAIGKKDLIFLSLNYDFKKKITKDFREKLNSSTIEEILSREISGRYKKISKDYNAKICEKIKKENIYLLQNLLSKNFLFFFDKIYYKNNKKINMKDFGFEDLEIDLSGIKLFYDVLINVKDDNNSLKEIMNLIAKNNFLPKKNNEVFECVYY